MKKVSGLIIAVGCFMAMTILFIAARPASKAPEKVIKIELTIPELNIVLSSLQERPMKDVGTVVLKIVNQAGPQLDSTSKK